MESQQIGVRHAQGVRRRVYSLSLEMEKAVQLLLSPSGIAASFVNRIGLKVRHRPRRALT
jgi:hypothetical protein